MQEIHSFAEMLMYSDESPREFPKGSEVFAEGDPAREMFIVNEGTVELRRGGKLLQTLGRGEIFGEMALLDPAPRSAAAVAGADCKLTVLDEATFEQLVRKVPGFALELLRLVVRRLRDQMARKAAPARRPRAKKKGPHPA